MSNPIDLLLNPTHDKGTHSSLKIQWVREFLDTGFLKPQHFLETVNDTPVWLEWVRKNCATHEASALVVEQFKALHFDWMAPTSSESPTRCIEYIFPYCNAEILDQILAQLPASALGELQKSVFEHKTPNLSLLSAAHHFEKSGEANTMVNMLLKWGWNIEERNERGETLLLQTPYWNDAHILLECGANVLAVDHNNTTVFDRVRGWVRHSRWNSTEITKTLNTYMRNAAPALNPDDQKKKIAITTMFSQIGQEKTGDLKKTLAVLQKIQASSNKLVDVAGRSLVQVLREQIFSHSLQAYDQAHTRFFSRVFVILMDNHEPGGLIDLDQPFAGHAQWSDRDVLNMMLSTLAANRNFKDGFLTSQMREDLKKWQSERFPHLVAFLHDFFQPALDNELGYVRELLIQHTTQRPVPSIFFNCVSHHLNALPFEHPLVQIVVDGLRVEHAKHNTGAVFDGSDYDNINVLPEDLLWAARYCETHNLDNNHPLVHMVDVQMMAMWSQWYIAHRGEVGDTYSYSSLKHADRKMFKRFVVERSHQIDQIDEALFTTWHAAQLKHHKVSSLYEIDSSRMDPSTLDLIARIQARVLHAQVQQHIGDKSLGHKSTRKM